MGLTNGVFTILIDPELQSLSVLQHSIAASSKGFVHTLHPAGKSSGSNSSCGVGEQNVVVSTVLFHIASAGGTLGQR